MLIAEAQDDGMSSLVECTLYHCFIVLCFVNNIQFG
ncbi:hypothetical protein CPS_3389 [Colwellia psychrerythraea 34H]|uniref:Uncharacterized protein n=1 Tax=Colwellia psychrerythraea (strain 34H / ATCC BAA-681) TaxID=167879 RepID=Q47YQ6_COLP3|nr:hypothetical protein CPS_3389 [Colwellia psychrerythraea 34H]